MAATYSTLPVHALSRAAPSRHACQSASWPLRRLASAETSSPAPLSACSKRSDAAAARTPSSASWRPTAGTLSVIVIELGAQLR